MHALTQATARISPRPLRPAICLPKTASPSRHSKRSNNMHKRTRQEDIGMRLGVCYYPEHWPEAMWKDDAARMKALGIKQVRIAEFAWSRIEPSPGEFNWAWL